MIVAAASAALDPMLCILAGGIGSAIGEQVSYLSGRIGLSWIRQDHEENNLVMRWLEKHDFLVVFLFAFVPLPVFDIAGLAAGANKMWWPRYMLAAVSGKILKFAVIVFGLRYFLPLYIEWLPENISHIIEQFLYDTGML